MSTETGVSPTSETAILSRLIRPEDDTLSPEAAEGFLRSNSSNAISTACTSWP